MFVFCNTKSYENLRKGHGEKEKLELHIVYCVRLYLCGLVRFHNGNESKKKEPIFFIDCSVFKEIERSIQFHYDLSS